MNKPHTLIKSMLFMVAAIPAIKAHAQNGEMKELLTAPTVKNFVSFKFNGEGKTRKLWYNVDSYRDDYRDEMENNKISVLVMRRKKGINLICRFLNPLHYSISSKDSSVIDPSVKDISTFMEAIAGFTKPLGVDVTGKIDAGEKAAISDPAKRAAITTMENKIESFQENVDDPKKLNEKTKYQAKLDKEKDKYDIALAKAINTDEAKIKVLTDSIYAPSLVSWKYHVLTAPDAEALSADFLMMMADLKKCADAFYGNIKEKNSTFNKNVTDAFGNMIQADDDLKKFYGAYEEFVATNKRLVKINAENEELIKAFEKTVSALKTDAEYVDDAETVAFIEYTRAALATFVGDMKQIQKKRAELLTSLQQLQGKLALMLPEKDGSMYNSNAMHVAYCNGEVEKIHTVTVDITYHEPSIKDNALTFAPNSEKSTSFNVRVRRYSSIAVELSGGMFYSSLKYEQYGTALEGGVMRLRQAKDVYSPVVAAVGLNMVFNSLHLSLVHPLIQVGVGTGKDRPSFLAGAGFKIDGLKSICITGGPIWAWQKRPQTFSEGEIIAGETQLKDDMKFVLDETPGMYIGLQYNF